MSFDWPKAAAEIRLPLLIHVAGRDRIIANKVAAQVFLATATPERDKSWKTWEEAHHTLCWDPLTPNVIETVVAWVLHRANP
jgi:esterase/lipase